MSQTISATRNTNVSKVKKFHNKELEVSEEYLNNLLNIPEQEPMGMAELVELGAEFGVHNFEHEPTSFAEIRQIISLINLDESSSCIDIGAGFGAFVLYGACVTPAQFRAIEIVPKRANHVRAAARRLGLKNIHVEQADAMSCDLRSADCVFLNNPFFNADTDRFMDKLRNEAPGGCIVAAINNIASHIRNSGRFAESDCDTEIPNYRFGMFRV